VRAYRLLPDHRQSPMVPRAPAGAGFLRHGLHGKICGDRSLARRPVSTETVWTYGSASFCSGSIFKPWISGRSRSSRCQAPVRVTDAASRLFQFALEMRLTIVGDEVTSL